MTPSQFPRIYLLLIFIDSHIRESFRLKLLRRLIRETGKLQRKKTKRAGWSEIVCARMRVRWPRLVCACVANGAGKQTREDDASITGAVLRLCVITCKVSSRFVRTGPVRPRPELPAGPESEPALREVRPQVPPAAPATASRRTPRLRGRRKHLQECLPPATCRLPRRSRHSRRL